MSALDRIHHIVVLMLENRSFDCLFGRLYPKSDGFDGLSGSESNPGPDGPITVWNSPGVDSDTMRIPDPDPGERFVEMNMQLFGTSQVPVPPPTAPMSGFVQNYVKQSAAAARNPRAPMHFFTPEQVPVLSRLARQFAVSDRWHASAPCQTWPNRFFVHTGTANGYENNAPPHFPYRMPTIFTRFNQLGLSDAWHIFFHDIPQALALSDLWRHLDRFRLYPEFRHHAAHGTLPSYSFIEPRYFPDVSLPNDMHPPHIVTLGEQLIADVYNVLRAGPAWTETLLIITFDEHGGCYDHVPPPAAEPPGPEPTQPFNFDRYGVRVPAVLVSPYIAQGTVLRPPADRPFDHTSILSTVRRRFELGAPLSNRESQAPDLSPALSLADPVNLGPPRLDALPFVPSPADVARARLEPLNGMQAALRQLAAHLPVPSEAGGLLPSIEAHITELADAGAQVESALDTTRGAALAFIKQQLTGLFRFL